jgi:hypothetical protein
MLGNPDILRVALMSDSRFDIKFLGMQIMIEELGLTEYEFGKAAPDLTAADLLRDEAPTKASA